MLRIGKLTDYALLIMGQMAREPDSVMSANMLAAKLHLTTPTVSKILKMLSEANLVNSIRGAEGGYRLALSAKKIRLTDIITSMEGEFGITDCCVQKKNCQIDSICTMRENWRKINDSVKSFLAQLTLTDMLEPLALNQGSLHGE